MPSPRPATSAGASLSSVTQYAPSQFGGSLGRKAAAADDAQTSANAVQTEATARRQSVEGVNLDEELVNLTTYQQAYSASARLVQAVKDMYDTLLSMVQLAMTPHLNIAAQPTARILDNLMSAQVRQSDASAPGDVPEKAPATSRAMRPTPRPCPALQSGVRPRWTASSTRPPCSTNKLSTQDLAINQMADSADNASQAIRNALASGSGDTLMQALQGFFSDASGALNTKFNGRFLFAGGQVNTQPVSATSLTQLTAAPSIASLFHNDQYVTSNQVDESTSINSGFLASNLGTGLFTAFQAIEAYNQGPNGPFQGQLTQAQQTFLQGQIASFDTENTNLTTAAGQNGLMQNQVDAVSKDLTGRQTMLTQAWSATSPTSTTLGVGRDQPPAGPALGPGGRPGVLVAEGVVAAEPAAGVVGFAIGARVAT